MFGFVFHIMPLLPLKSSGGGKGSVKMLKQLYNYTMLYNCSSKIVLNVKKLCRKMETDFKLLAIKRTIGIMNSSFCDSVRS